MLCSLAKWLVSRREDTGKPLPAWTGHHLRCCSSCREFEQLVSRLGDKGTAAAEESGKGIALDKTTFIPVESDSPPKPTGPPRRRLVPALILVGLLALAGAGIVWLATPRRTPLPGLNTLIDSGRVNAVRDEILSVESPLRLEKDGIERSLDLAVKFLIESLNPGLGD